MGGKKLGKELSIIRKDMYGKKAYLMRNQIMLINNRLLGYWGKRSYLVFGFVLNGKGLLMRDVLPLIIFKCLF